MWSFSLIRSPLDFLLYCFLAHTTYTDIKYQKIRNQTIASMLVVRLVWFVTVECKKQVLWSAIISEGILILLLAIVLIGVYVWTKDGIGAGDVKLILASSLYLGLERTLAALTASAILLTVVYCLTGKDWKDKMCFAPFWSIGLILGKLVG